MILTKYILKKILKNQLIVLVLLCLVCVCQKLIKIFELGDNIPIHLFFLYLILSIPELIKLIIPFSLFLSIIITCYHLHMHNAIIVIYSCAIKKSFLIQLILLYSFTIACFAFINMSWLSPYCTKYCSHTLLEIKKNTYFNKLIEKKFQLFSNKKLVLFIGKINDKLLQNVFIFKNSINKNNNTFSIITAEQGCMFYNDKHLQSSIILNTGIYYEIPNHQKNYPNIYVTNFSQHRLLMDCNPKPSNKIHNIANNMSMSQLYTSETIEAKIELNWRLTLLISIFIIPVITFLLMTNFLHSYLSNFLLSIGLYTFFFLSHILLKSHAILDYTNSMIWIWLINTIYFMMVFMINSWQSFKFKFFLKRIFLYIFK